MPGRIISPGVELNSQRFQIVNDRDGRVRLAPVEGPQIEWDSLLSLWQATLAHEQKVTGMIGKLVDLSLEHGDHSTNNFLQWFVGEQVEEEATAKEWLQKLRLVSDSGAGIYMVDQELATRVFTTPVWLKL